MTMSELPNKEPFTTIALKDILEFIPSNEERGKHIASLLPHDDRVVNIDLLGVNLAPSCAWEIIRVLFQHFGFCKFKKQVRFVDPSDCDLLLLRRVIGFRIKAEMEKTNI